MHHPVHEYSSHEPVEVFLSHFNVVRLHIVVFLSVLQPDDCLYLSAHVQLCLNLVKFLQLFFIIYCNCYVFLFVGCLLESYVLVVLVVNGQLGNWLLACAIWQQSYWIALLCVYGVLGLCLLQNHCRLVNRLFLLSLVILLAQTIIRVILLLIDNFGLVSAWKVIG